MGRYTLDQGAITVAYGWDHITGYFLAVTDSRLAWSMDATDAVNAIAEKVNVEGGGSYFNLHTGPSGFGHKVDIATLTSFWAAYGVPAAHVQRARNNGEL